MSRNPIEACSCKAMKQFSREHFHVRAEILCKSTFAPLACKDGIL